MPGVIEEKHQAGVVAPEKKEAYMLKRDAKETKRLNFQHEFLKVLGDGLIHPLIPLKQIRAVADIATGTGIWLDDISKTLAEHNPDVEYVGFDISGDQFPPNPAPGHKYEVHDASKPFPSQYREKFDLVNVRFLSYAITQDNMQKLVDCISDTIRPGGYLQWQEIDGIDTWSIPETQGSRDMISYIIAERLARGLPPAIVTPLITAIRSTRSPVPEGKRNTVSWTDDVLRVLKLDSITTVGHPSPIVAAGMKGIVGPGSTELLSSSVDRQKALLEDDSANLSDAEKAKVKEDLEKVVGVVTALTEGRDPATNSWQTLLTWIVARKAFYVDKDQPWMEARFST